VKVLAIALGGNALSPPAGDQSYGAERSAVARSSRSLARLAAQGYRLLIVHGNGPQVGRLMREDADTRDLDVHVAQTQGELGYLIAQALETATGAPCAALVTRVVVDPADPAFAAPTKPVGPLLAGGGRRLVASPRPVRVLEQDAILALLERHHVVAGGGGGIPVAPGNGGIPGVVDKDWVAAKLALAAHADALLFGTDVAGVFDRHGRPDAAVIATLRAAEARSRLAARAFAAGSMAPKIESAVEFVAATGRRAVVLHADDLARGLDEPPPGTLIVA
jgi:carbamate kinase